MPLCNLYAYIYIHFWIITRIPVLSVEYYAIFLNSRTLHHITFVAREHTQNGGLLRIACYRKRTSSIYTWRQRPILKHLNQLYMNLLSRNSKSMFFGMQTRLSITQQMPSGVVRIGHAPFLAINWPSSPPESLYHLVWPCSFCLNARCCGITYSSKGNLSHGTLHRYPSTHKLRKGHYSIRAGRPLRPLRALLLNLLCGSPMPCLPLFLGTKSECTLAPYTLESSSMHTIPRSGKEKLWIFVTSLELRCLHINPHLP